MNLLGRCVVISRLLLGGAAAAPIAGTFQQLDCEGGGWFEQVIPHSSGRIYGRTDVGGMYRSDDHGDHWQWLSGDLPSLACYLVQGVAVAAGNADVVYQAVGTSYTAGDPAGGIWKSINGGASWMQMFGGVTFSGNDEQRWGGECLVIQPGNDSELWAGTRGQGLYHSTDAGTTWLEVSPKVFHANLRNVNVNPKICGILIYPATAMTPEHLWVYGDGGAWLSIDHGGKWTKRLAAKRVYRMAQQLNGTTFAAGITASRNGLWRIFAADWKKPVFKLTDLYLKHAQPRGAPAKGYLGALDFPPAKESHLATVSVLSNGDVIAADLFENTCRSTDDGDHFTRLPMTLTGSIPAWVAPGVTTIDGGRNSLAEDPTNSARLYLGGGYAPFRSDDGGATWRFIHNGVGETVAWRANFDPADHNRVWLPIADLGCTTVSDGGASGVSSGYIAPHFPDDDIVMFTHRLLISAGRVIAPGGEQTRHSIRLYQTTDQGAAWTRLKTTGLPSGANEILDAVASPTNSNDALVFAAGPIGPRAGGVYRTTNLDAGTTDAGATFVQAKGLPVGFDSGSEFNTNVFLERDSTNASLCFLLLRDRGFYTSTDGGSNWTKPAAQPDNTFGMMHVDPVSHRVWLGLLADGGTGIGLEWSDDAGATWRTLSGVQSASEFDVHDGRIALLGQLDGDTYDHIYYSADGGATWGEISGSPGKRFANAQAVAVDPWHPGTVWISTNGRAIARFVSQ